MEKGKTQLNFWWEKHITRKLVSAILRFMSLSFRFNSTFKENLVITEEFGGKRFLNAAFLFRTRDHAVKIAAVFENGKMRVKKILTKTPILLLFLKGKNDD